MECLLPEESTRDTPTAANTPMGQRRRIRRRLRASRRRSAARRSRAATITSADATDVAGREVHPLAVEVVRIARCLDHRDAVVTLGRSVVDVAKGDHQSGHHRSWHATDLTSAVPHRLVALGLRGVAEECRLTRAELLEPVGVVANHALRLGAGHPARPRSRQTLLQCPDMERR